MVAGLLSIGILTGITDLGQANTTLVVTEDSPTSLSSSLPGSFLNVVPDLWFGYVTTPMPIATGPEGYPVSWYAWSEPESTAANPLYNYLEGLGSGPSSVGFNFQSDVPLSVLSQAPPPGFTFINDGEVGLHAATVQLIDGSTITYDVVFRDNAAASEVPEPTTMLLLGSGLIGLAGYGRKKFFKK